MEEVGKTRKFQNGYITMYGTLTEHAQHMVNYPGLRHVSVHSGKGITDSLSWEDIVQLEGEEVDGKRTKIRRNKANKCDIIETRPAFVLSNDDIFNLGHYINDVMNVWNMLMLSGVDSKDAILVNIDGLRSGGPAGGLPNRMMVPSEPDTHGPYAGYYEVMVE